MNELDPNDLESVMRKLNQDTAKIEWQLLAEHQQQEAVVEVDLSLDLILVGCEFVRDSRKQVEEWLADGLLAKVSDETAECWARENKEVWAVVVAPWVLVQQIKS